MKYMTRIFISYRRSDSTSYAQRLYDRLSVDFGSGAVFMDVATIQPGAQFDLVIAEAVSKCDVLIAIIGPQWLKAVDEQGPRLNNPDDLVRIEIESALKRDVLVIPILVHGAVMPKRQELPEVLRGLARRNALKVSAEDWAAGVAKLEIAIQSVVRLRSLGLKIFLNQQYCPVCGNALPKFEFGRPKTLRQRLLGGWTCSKCGTSLDRNARVLA
jgi:hypothetical protein